MRYTQHELERFNTRWLKKGECYIWQGYLDKDGYGTFFFRRISRRAHRVSYFIHIGDIPKGMVIDHICGNPSCVNPAHLRAISNRENILDGRGIGAINARRTHCKFGHPLDRKYGKQRYCSKCAKEKSRRLRAKWKADDKVMC